MTEVAEEKLATEKRWRMARWLSGSGIEIGALHHPLSVPEGVHVRYVDRMPEAELRQHYKELEGEAFAPISIIGDAQDLSNIEDDSVDFVIANHLVEHLDNPIRGLEEMVRILRPGGVLYLALPDPRVTFDFERQLTSVEHLVDEYRNGPDQTREAHFHDWVEKVEAHTHFDRPDNVDQRVQTLLQMDYSIHYHLWRPDTFLDFLSALRRETGIELELVDFAPCDHGKDNEFIFVFLKGIAAMPVAIPPLPPPVDEALPVPGVAQAEATANGWLKGLKRRLGASPVGPLLRPVYRAGRQLLKR
jgi:SAM-dependent methyltransferase